MGEGVLLLAQDTESLGMLSACLQDALVPVIDMAYLPAERRFVLVVNRFRWEVLLGEEPVAKRSARANAALHERVLCGVRFDNVVAARTRGLDLRQRGQVLNLLCVRQDAGEVLLSFSGGAFVALACESLACVARDLGDPWPTPCCPQHALDTL
jgi:hypothetical protein